MEHAMSIREHTDIPEGYGVPGDLASPFTVRDEPSWVDLDALGHVNHAVYLRFFENARMKYFQAVGIEGISYATAEDGAVGPILATMTVNYRQPVGFPDPLFVKTSCTKIGRTSFTLEAEIWSTRNGGICAQGSFVVVLLDYANNNAKVRVPEPVRAAMRALDADLSE
jgi:acyl-CoA thioester hydrolase